MLIEIDLFFFFEGKLYRVNNFQFIDIIFTKIKIKKIVPKQGLGRSFFFLQNVRFLKWLKNYTHKFLYIH